MTGRNRYTAREVLDLIASQDGPVSWRELVGLAAADDPRSITQLRQMLKGLQRSEELERDHLGAYHLPDQGEVVEGIVRRSGRQLGVEGVVIEDPQRFSLRAGDVVAVRLQGERARVVNVISHAAEPVTGILHWQGKYPYVEGLGDFRGRVSLLEPPLQGRHGDTVQVRIVDRDRRGLVGICEGLLLESDAPVLDQAIETALAGAHIPSEWPVEVEQAAAALPQRVQGGRFSARSDLRDLPLVTIDGETARDFDDAVFAEPLGRGRGWRLVVAIADVGHYVRPGSAIDREAVNRGTSVYFPERVVPMLPEALSNELCSLKPDVPRLAVAVEMQVNGKGEVSAYSFCEAVIHSHARLTYNEVQAYLDDGKPLPVDDAAVRESVTALAELHDAFRAARARRGALDFATNEGELELENGRVKAIHPVARLEAHQLIEEAMIAANVCAARFLEEHEQPGLYRIHEPPDASKMEELRQALAHAGVRLPPGDVAPGALQRALEQLPEHADPALYAQLALRSLQQAVYTPANAGHYGLALERYMHFTSPIRRYPDLVVHRAIKAVLARTQGRKVKGALPSMDELHQLGGACSHNERRAESAAWLVDAWLKCDYLVERIGDKLAGKVAGVTEFGLFVDLEGYYVQGLLHISGLGNDYYIYHPRTQALVGERSGRSFALGDKLDVIVRDIEPPQGRIDLELPGHANRREGKRKGRRGRR